MSKSRGLSGGGIEGAKVKHAKAPKVEPKPRAINPGHMATSLGGKVGTRKAITPMNAGPGYKTPVGPSPSMGQGPGANRTIYPCGSQSKTSAAKPMPAGRDTLAEFGPDIPGRRR